MSLQGIFSGTLSYIFNTWPKEVSSFSDCVLQAREQGFTEPDPRDDLNGDPPGPHLQGHSFQCHLSRREGGSVYAG